MCYDLAKKYYYALKRHPVRSSVTPLPSRDIEEISRRRNSFLIAGTASRANDFGGGGGH